MKRFLMGTLFSLAILFDVPVVAQLQSTVGVARETEAIKQAFPVTVNYKQSAEEMIKAGQYDWSDSDVNSNHFLSEKKGVAKLSIRLVHFDRYMTLMEVMAALNDMNLRPVTLSELLALGNSYPRIGDADLLENKFPIAAVGSVWRHANHSEFPMLMVTWSGDWGIGLQSSRGQLGPLARFAAVDK